MTDRELLELAAKAAGMNYVHDLCGRYSDPEFNEVVEWNPLTDDGDSLRLAVTVGIHITNSTTDAWASTLETTAIQHAPVVHGAVDHGRGTLPIICGDEGGMKCPK